MPPARHPTAAAPPSSGVVAWRRLDALPGTAAEAGEETGPRAAASTAHCLFSRGYLTNRRQLLADDPITGPGELTGQGERISDGELAARVFARHGRSTLQRLAGPISCVLWHPGRRELLAFRDRIGIQPLVYTLTGSTLTLAAAPLELLAAGERQDLDPAAIARHLCGFPPAAGGTFFRGLAALPPAHALLVTPQRHELFCYWRPEDGPALPRRSDEDHAAALLDLLQTVVAEHASGLPTGITLSGGLDSASLAALAADAPGFGAPPYALTWSAPETPEADETAEARRVRTFLGLAGTEIPVGQHGPLTRELTSEVHPDEPTFGFYTTLWEATFEAARERGLQTLLTGASGDHLFGGNVFSYADLLLGGRWLRLAREWRRHAAVSDLGPTDRLRRMLVQPILDAWVRPQAPLALLHPPEWMAPALRAQLAAPPPRRDLSRLPGRVLRLRELHDPLLPALSAQLTARARRAGLDLRHPLLDHRLFELAAALPSRCSFEAGLRKGILRRALHGRLPDETLTRARKIYPRAIARRCLRGPGGTQARRLMTEMRAEERGFVAAPALRAAYERLRSGPETPLHLWHALTLEAWLRHKV